MKIKIIFQSVRHMFHIILIITSFIHITRFMNGDNICTSILISITLLQSTK